MGEPITTLTPVASIPSARSSGFWLVTRRLLRDRSVVFSLLVVLFFTLVAAFAPAIAPHDPSRQNSGVSYRPPAWVARGRSGSAGSPQFLLGTDTLGRDVLSRLIYGARSSLSVSLLAVLVTGVVGTLLGALAGLTEGWGSRLLLRFMDILFAFPTLLFYIMVLLALREQPVSRLGNGMVTLIIALSAVGWVGLARLIRSVVLLLRQEAYVEAARSLGAGQLQILFRHILPNALNILLVWMTFTIPYFIVIEATLGYLGIGFSPRGGGSEFFVTSWGGLIEDGRLAVNNQPAILIATALCIGAVSMAFTYLGDGLRDALDPRMHEMV